jgi:cytochrome c oxidase assembly protein subunit 11
MTTANPDNRRLLTKLTVVAVAMFGFGFALVPFYKKICEVTGVNNLLAPDEAARSTQVDYSRQITVEFDANIHGLAWQFKPLQSSIVVRPGELVHAAYEVVNTRERAVSGQAIPSYGPKLAGQYFRKMECFCFTRQTLAGGEAKRMPVVFVVDPALPKDVNTITLSYTFFEVEGAAANSGSATAVEGGSS